jgi:hypothetical protein
MKSKTKLSEAELIRIIQTFDNDESLVPYTAMEVREALPLQDSTMLSARLERAALNQLAEVEATVSRYAIWAETVRGIVLDALISVGESPQHEATKRNLTKAANSLAAFSTVQSRLDPM